MLLRINTTNATTASGSKDKEIEDMVWLVLLITLIIIVPIAIVASSMRNNLIAEGKIVNRAVDFAEKAEIFTMRRPADYSYITNGVMNLGKSNW